MEDMEGDNFQHGEENEEATFVLNTGSTCFLCLNKTSPSGFLQDGYPIKCEDGFTPEPQTVHLSTIYRYLDLNVSQILTQDGQASLKQISVNLCQGCSLVAGKLSSLCSELEQVQMKVDQCLESFFGIMNQNKDNDAKVDQYLTSAKTSENSSEFKIWNAIRKMRDETIKSCTKRLKIVVPKMTMVNSTSTQPVPNPQVSTAPTEKNQITSDKVAQRICIHCSPHRSFKPSDFQRHQICQHIETFFTSSKLPHLTIPAFKLYCEHVFKVELLPKNPNDKITRQCPHCQASYRNPNSFRQHLFSAHFEILSQKILRLQETCSVAEIIEISTSKGICQLNFSDCGVTFTQKCMICGNRFSDEDKLSEHMKTDHCPDQVSPEENLVLMTVQSGRVVTCNLCTPPHNIDAKRFRRHRVSHHIETFFSTARSPYLPPTDFKFYCDHVIKVEMLSCSKIPGDKGIPSRKCPHCESSYRDQDALRKHFCLVHQEILAGKIMELQKTSTVAEIKEMSAMAGNGLFKCEACETTFSQKGSFQRHKKHSCKYGPRKRLPNWCRKCTICKKRFWTEDGYLEHKRREHPEELMVPKVEKNVDELEIPAARIDSETKIDDSVHDNQFDIEYNVYCGKYEEDYEMGMITSD